MNVILQLSCYNGAKYLPYVFASLKTQTHQNWSMHVLDNASDEKNAIAIRQAIEQSGLPITLHRVERNIGFAGAHRLLFEQHKNTSDVVQLLNDDAILEPEYLERCISYLSSHSSCGSVSGRVYRWDFDRRDEPTKGKTPIIDTLGLTVRWNGYIRDIGAGMPAEQTSGPTKTSNVFGVSGCLPMYRVSALKLVNIDQSLFDASFVSYKEDCELAFRLRAGGYTSAIVPDAVAYHRRSMGVGVTHTAINPENAYLSYRNHLWLWMMHLTLVSACTNRVGVIPTECAKTFYWLFRRPTNVFRIIRDTYLEWPRLMEQRSFIRELKATRPAFTTHEVQPPKTDIAVIMVCHNDLSDECLASLAEAKRQSKRRVDVVVVDNHSMAFQANERVARHLPDAWVILRNGDFGYGRSMNRGARQIDASYYFILNPDTVLSDSSILDTMADYLETHADVGMVAPKILSFSGDLQDTCRRFPSLYQPLIQRTSLKETSFGKAYTHRFLMKEYDHVTERRVDWVQGSAMFVRGTTWNRLGGFDDRFWMYFEDVDLCRRVWHMGQAVVYLPRVTIKHAHGRQSALIKNFILNIIKTKETRGHLASWIKYVWKWRFES